MWGSLQCDVEDFAAEVIWRAEGMDLDRMSTSLCTLQTKNVHRLGADQKNSRNGRSNRKSHSTSE